MANTNTQNAVVQFNAAVASRLPQHRTPTYEQRMAAVSYVARAQPALHRAFLVASNPGSRQARLLDEKYN